MDLVGKRCLVTGAASGIGRATAELFAEKGASELWLCDIDESGLAQSKALVESRNAKTQAIVRGLDVTDFKAVRALYKFLDAAEGIDVVFNNAGIVSGPPAFPATSVQRIETMVAINLTSVIVGAQAAIAVMAKRSGGAIINVSSMGVFNPFLSDAPYNATKAGVIAFTESCKELHKLHNIRVNAVVPGVTETPILEKTGGGQRPDWLGPILAGIRVLRPSEIAEAVVRLIEDETTAGEFCKLANEVASGGVRE